MHISHDPSSAPLHERVVARAASLSPRERSVALWLSDHPEEVVSATALELAEEIGVSNATVIRAIKALGYDGLPDLRKVLSLAIRDRMDPSRVLGQRIDRIGDESVVQRVLETSAQLLLQERRVLDPQAWQRAVSLLEAADVVFCYGIEQAGSVADVFAQELEVNGRRSRALNQTGISLARALLPLRQTDAVLIIAPLRHFREIELVIDQAEAVGAATVLISEALGHALQTRVDAVIGTPQSTLGAASELLAPLAIVGALALEIATHHRDDAIDHYARMNLMRETIMGGSVDVGNTGNVAGPLGGTRPATSTHPESRTASSLSGDTSGSDQSPR